MSNQRMPQNKGFTTALEGSGHDDSAGYSDEMKGRLNLFGGFEGFVQYFAIDPALTYLDPIVRLHSTLDSPTQRCHSVV